MNPHPDNAEAEGQRERWDALRAVLAAQRGGPPLQTRAHDGVTPASFAQRRLWFLEQLEPGTRAHILTVAHQLTGVLNLSALERALSEVARRHEVLRTTLAYENGRVVQRVHPAAPVPLPVIDLRALDAEQRPAELTRRTDAEVADPFDLQHGPLLRARLLRVADAEHRLLVSVHHAVFDGWSFDVFMAEVGTLYGAFVAGCPSPLPEPGLQYGDVAVWQQQRCPDSPRWRASVLRPACLG